ncbi:hypothetical protein [Demequina litorisediminis]|uniref:hypothetical protein n=1 Tax=Demequina litorisediminis TaxID=1849022 RepID=UPI003D67224A
MYIRLERQVHARLHGQLVVALALAVNSDAPQDQTPGNDADDERGNPGSVPERDDAAGLIGDLRSRGKRAVLDALGTTREQEDRGRRAGTHDGFSGHAGT